MIHQIILKITLQSHQLPPEVAENLFGFLRLTIDFIEMFPGNFQNEIVIFKENCLVCYNTVSNLLEARTKTGLNLPIYTILEKILALRYCSSNSETEVGPDLLGCSWKTARKILISLLEEIHMAVDLPPNNEKYFKILFDVS